MQASFETVAVELTDGVGRLTLDRPASLNAMNGTMREEIEHGLEWLEANEGEGELVRVVTIEGAGDRAFCAGADINDFSGGSRGAFAGHTMRDSVIEFPAPVVAAIDGYCLGGGLELALACDFRLASESSELGFPEIDLGLIPGAGGVQYVARLCGPSVAKELAMTGEYITAERAGELGILNHVFADDAFAGEVDSFCETIAAKPPLAIRAVKDSGNVAVESDLHEGRKYDRRVFATLLETHDHEEGVRAFEEEEYTPEFTGT